MNRGNLANGNRRGFGVAAALLLGAALVPAAATAAAPTSVADVANYAGADRQAVLEAGARKEGSVQLYATGTQDDPMYDRFRAKYPYIKLGAFRAPGTEAARRIIEENNVGRFTADAIFLNTGALGIIRNAGVLQPYTIPEIAVYKKEAIEPGRHWIYDYQSYLNLAWNTKEIKEADVPKTYDDLLDPKWKGKMTVSDWSSTYANWIGVLTLTRGEDFVLKLAQQNFIAYSVSPRAVANFLVSGESPISPVIYSSHIAASKKSGASVEWRALGPAFTQVGAVSLSKKAPHPNAAMLLIEFFLSKEGQTMRQDLGYATARMDMTNAAAPSEPAIDLTARPDFEKEFEEWTALGLKVFGKGKAPPKQ